MESVNGTVQMTNVNSNKVLINKNNKTISQFVWFAERCWIMLFICASKKFFSLFKRTQMCFVLNQFPLLEKKILAILRWHWSHFLDCPSGYVQNAGHIPGTGQINPTTSYSSTIGDCSKRCNDTNCCSFEYSDTNYLCYMNILCQPTQSSYIDFSFCTKVPSMLKNYRIYGLNLNWTIIGRVSRGSILIPQKAS